MTARLRGALPSRPWATADRRPDESLTMRLALRWKIMTFTVLPLVTLAFGTTWIVDRSVSEQMQRGIHDDLRRGSAVVENLLDARARALVAAGQMIAQDPRFLLLLSVPRADRDPRLRAILGGVAQVFNGIAQAD